MIGAIASLIAQGLASLAGPSRRQGPAPKQSRDAAAAQMQAAAEKRARRNAKRAAVAKSEGESNG